MFYFNVFCFQTIFECSLLTMVSNNSTAQNNETTNAVHHNEKIALIVVDGILLVIAVYAFSALLYYELKIEKRKKSFFSLSLEAKYERICRWISISVSASAILKMLFSFLFLLLRKYAVMFNLDSETGDIICDVMLRIDSFVLTLGVSVVYLFLWFRQRIFYIHPSISVSYTKVVRLISSAVAIVWVLYYLVIFLCYLILVEHAFEYGNCVMANSVSKDKIFNIILSWTLLLIFMQVALLGLFIYPIITITALNTSKNSQTSKLVKRVKKAVILSIVCLVSDTLAFVLRFYASIGVDVYNIDLVINVFVTIFCFDNWRTMLFPRKVERYQNAPSTKNSQTCSKQVTISSCA